MPTITTPISRAKRATRNESSSIIGSVRESGMVSKQWIKDKRDSDNQFAATNALSKLQSDVAKIRRIKAGGAPLLEQYPTILPLQVYQIGENALKFQIRSGLVGMRSRYWKNGHLNSGGSESAFGTPCYSNQGSGSIIYSLEQSGNFETLCTVNGDSFDNGINWGSNAETFPITSNKTIENSNSVTLDLATDTLISGRDSLGNLISYNCILAPDMTGKQMGVIGGSVTGLFISFYVEIVDDSVDGVVANLWGRCSVTDTSATTDFTAQNYAFPNPNETYYGNQNFPLAAIGLNLNISLNKSETLWICTGFGNEHSYNQIQVGNAINRFSSYTNSNGGYLGGALLYRGKWIGNSLSGQFFYPGDMVYDDSAAYLTKSVPVSGGGGGTGSFSYQGQYVFKATKPAFKTTAPHSDSTNWQYIGAVI